MLTRVRGAETAPAPMQIARAAGLLVILSFLIWSASRAGFATLLSTYAAGKNQFAAASAAVSLSPRDPDVHHLRASMLEANDDLSTATVEYAQAVSLRPDDYVLWLNLAHARELNGDMSGAMAAAGEAVRLAPYYAQPHWQLGNLLVRAGRQEGGFSELRLAGDSNSSLLPSIVDLAWQLSRGDVEYVKRAIQPHNREAYMALAECFKKRGQVQEVIALLRSAGDLTEDYRRQYVAQLISAKQFQDAYALWSIAHPEDPDASNAAVARGFEVKSDLDEPGFGWRGKKAATVVLSLDDANPKEGNLSLRIEFKGDSDPGVPVITQLVMVDPHAHYQLHFAARTAEIVSGGLPEVTILDANLGQPLGQSGALPPGTNSWHDYTFDFIVPETTSAIQIVLQRKRCSRSPCPIFGRLWLDNFSVKKT